MSAKARLVDGIGIAVVFGLVVFWATRQPEPSRPLDLTYGDIASVEAYPVPGGKPAPPMLADLGHNTDGHALANYAEDIPSPFPAPVHCDRGIDDGVKITVWTREGERLDYLSCAFPDELDALYLDVFRPHS
jgi:hypothetical protein